MLIVFQHSASQLVILVAGVNDCSDLALVIRIIIYLSNQNARRRFG